jgi:hypothetical protein
MDEQEILKKAIEKAKKNGWKSELLLEKWGICAPTAKDLYYLIIFDQGFAKAFWGVDPIKFPLITVWHNKNTPKKQKRVIKDKAYLSVREGTNDLTFSFNPKWMPPIFEWQYHLQQMVVQDDPIKYLEQFI